MARKRHRIQALGALAFNGNLKGFVQGQIYQGSLKKVCVPVLNCYSCPGALGSCPIGSAQAVLGSRKFHFSYYVLGLILLFGITLGRFYCGYLCPFGFIQDLIYKITKRRVKIPKKLHGILTKLKYLLLIGPVLLLPWLQKVLRGIGDPLFCKYICPAGILEGALPLMAKDITLRSAIGALFHWKLFLALLILGSCIFIYRVFCKYLCPLGAFYGLCNPIAFYGLEVNDHTCIRCNQCSRVCKMEIEPYKRPNSSECIRCLDCVHVCPTKAIYPVIHGPHGKKILSQKKAKEKNIKDPV